MKKVKLNIDDLKVQSFVTSFDKDTQETVKGGTDESVELCSQGPVFCEEDSIQACAPVTSPNVPGGCITGNHWLCC